MWMYTLLPEILNMSLTASIVILFVLTARILLKKAPKVFSYILWAVVLFRLVCPVSFSSPISLTGLIHAPDTVDNRMTYIPRDIVHIENPKVDLPIPAVNNIINDSLPQGEEQLVADPLEAFTAALTVVWLIIIVFILLLNGISWLKLRRKLIGAVHLKENIYLLDHFDTPMVYGVIRPKIYLPSSLAEQEQEYIILHEKIHIKRLDPVFKMVAFLAMTMHWFNPLVHVAFGCFVKDMEMSCDERVLKILGSNIKADYSTSLLSLTSGRRMKYGNALAFGEGSIKGRIKNILSFKKPRLWMVGAMAVLILLLSIGLAANGTHKISLPLPDSVLSIRMETVSKDQNDGFVVITDEGEIKHLLFSLSDAIKTSSKSQIPTDDYMMIQIQLSNGQRTLYLYERDDLYLVDLDGSTYRVKGKTNDIYAIWEEYTRDKEESDEKLAKVTVGMHLDKVHELLGRPYGALSGSKGDLYILSDQTVIGIYYDSKDQVERLEEFDSPEFLKGDSMTLEDIRELAKKGDDLVFEDFKRFKGANVSSSFDTYIMVYYVEEGYRLIVQCGVEGGKPKRADLENVKRSSGTGIDIRYKSIDEFLQSNPPATDVKSLLLTADVEPGNEPESIFIEQTEDHSLVSLLVQNSNGDEIWREEFFTAHAGWNSLFLYEAEGRQYLLRYIPYMGQGYALYTYTVFTLQNGKEKVVQTRTIEFDINGNAPLNISEMMDFADSINALLKNSTLLLSSEGGVFLFGLSSTDDFLERYSWLDTYPKLYSESDRLEDRLKKHNEYVLKLRSMEKNELYQLTEEEKEKAENAVMKYYDGTVFKNRVVKIEFIEDSSTYQTALISLKVKDRVAAFYITMDDQAKRMIILTKDDDLDWQVINEGV